MSDGKAPEGGVDLTALKALAEKATKGKRSWCTSGETPCDILLADGQEVLWDDWYRTKPEDHDFIAACDPGTILALIAEIESMKARRCENCAEWYADETPWTMIGDKTPWCHHFGCAGEEGYVQTTKPDFGCSEWRARE